MPQPADEHTGARIAHERKNRGLTQQGLAMRANVSLSLLAKVEAGAKPASPSLIAACERAMKLPSDVLTGAASPNSLEDDHLRTRIEAIRSTLDLYDLPPEEEVGPRPLRQLRAAVRTINTLAQAAKYRPMTEQLPGLLIELHTAAHVWTGADQIAAWGLLSEAYRCGHSVGIAMGMTDLSTVALNRMDWAAQRAGARGPALRAAREYLRVTAYLRRKDYTACQRLNASGQSLLAGAEADDPGADAARGQLHLGAAVIAARVGDEGAREGHLEEAERYAQRTGEVSTFWFGFGPTNVRVHRAMTLVELGEYDKAVDAGAQLRFPTGWLPTRIGHHYFDLARAYHWMNRPAQAMRQLERAKRVAPQQARRHPEVRKTVQLMLDAPGRTPAGLPQYAKWIGL
ncbi:helix-turn-helix domain-containing protein [Streptomyces sp. RPT161]|uniref:helix-turn-helix domain-containing protein n=1 Tax=Streptomyces sp. RPT161 TaxID=3015993 RepID=UPI0022B8E9E9|nr:helix-turn-helix transcriptional regulator [Streptomyces sp. RPT161]